MGNYSALQNRQLLKILLPLFNFQICDSSKRLRLILFIGLIFGLFRANAQHVTGKVVDTETGNPIENVNIFNSTSKKGIGFTNAQGEFSIQLEKVPAELRFSAIGYQAREVKISSEVKKIEIRLLASSYNLSEVLLQSPLIPDTLRKVPAAIALVSAKDLSRTDPTNLAQVFNSLPGVYVNQGALNTTKLTIRGVGSRAQYSTNRIQAFFDGIPLTTGEGELTLDDFDAETLDHIEVIKGPVSSLYGAGLAGSINLFSKKAVKGTHFSLESQAGSFKTFKEGVSGSYATNKISLFSHITALQSDGARENGNYDRKSFFLNGTFQISDKDDLNFLANFTRLKAYIPSSLNKNDFKNNPSKADDNWAAARGYEWYDRGLMGISNNYSFSGHFSNLTSIYSSFRKGYEPRPFNILDESRTSAGIRTQFQYNYDRTKAAFGADFYDEWYEAGTFQNLYRQYSNPGSVEGNRLSHNKQIRNYINFFAQINYDLTQKLKVETGFNFNSTHYKLTDLFSSDEIDQTGNYSFRSIFSPRLAASYSVNSHQNIYASISHGFSTPTVAETLTPEGLINTDIQPETGLNYEMGFKGNWNENKLYTEVSLYSIQIKDQLVAKRIGQDQYVGINAGKTSHSGAEIYARYFLDLSYDFKLKPFVNASFNNFRFKDFTDDEITYNGNKIPGVPNNTVNLGVEASYRNNISLYANMFHAGKIPLNDANSKFAGAYSLLNIKGSFTQNLSKKIKLEIWTGINNLFNEKYAASVLPNAVGFGGAAPRYYYPGNPVNYYGGIRVSLNN
ncbi:MAG: TonB-dependent receptor [Gillisia sp.]